ncbi:MAG TPA: transposase [Gammaproteobacteria bacterium]|nr:transposase [Gammaproteobacteria bacterium]
MDSLPPALLDFISVFRPLLRAEVFDSFTYLLCGLLIGEAKHGTVRASVFAPPDYQPQRLSDLFCRHKLSRQALMAQLTQEVLTALYAGGLPPHLFWLADSTLTEKPFVRCVASVDLFHRAKRIVGRAKHLQGHCYVFAAHLYQTAQRQWASVLVGALLYVKGRSIPQRVGDLAQQLRLPALMRHVWVVDRGITSRPLVRSLDPLGQSILGRVRSNQVFYFAPRRQPSRGRRRTYGQKCRVDQLIKRFPERLHQQTATLKVRGKERTVRIYDTEMLWRGVWHDRPCPVRLLVVVVPGLRLKPWYLVTTDLALAPWEAVQAYGGRQQIEVNFDEIKELGLGHYQGRSGEGVRRWPVFLCVAHTLLKLLATEALSVELPLLNWSWYKQDNTLGQIRRRLIEACRPPISRAKATDPTAEKMKKAA